MPEVRVLRTDEMPTVALVEVRRVLDAAFAGAFSDDDWAHTLGGWHVLVTEPEGAVLAHAAVVERTLEVGERPFRTGYVEGVAVVPGRQGEGLGSLAMASLDGVVRRRFELGALSTDRQSFYERLGWERWRGPSRVRRGSDVVRTADDDDGLMVLRFGASAGADLHESLTCEQRSGDDW